MSEPDWDCSRCGGPYHPATGHVHTLKTRLCGSCARDYAAWLKARMGSMHSKRKGDTTSFADAAASSIKPKDTYKVPAPSEETSTPERGEVRRKGSVWPSHTNETAGEIT